jgi:hypothetical protein
MANAELDRLLRLAIAQRRLISLTDQGCRETPLGRHLKRDRLYATVTPR